MSIRLGQGRIRELACRGRKLELGRRTLIMGILNATPDSFSDGGLYDSPDRAAQRALQMVQEGADVIDIGGESTRPGAVQVSAEEELSRIIPIIRAVSSRVDVPISVDTYKAEVARQALEAGAHMINDVWGCKGDEQMAAVAAAYGCPIIVMHNRAEARYTSLLSDLLRDLRDSVNIARRAGVSPDLIMVDPGIGFAKNLEQNLHVLGSLGEIAGLGYPVLLGTSRKSVIHRTLERPATDVLEGTAVTIALGIAQGCDIMRVHDVAAMKRAAIMADAILRRNGSEED